MNVKPMSLVDIRHDAENGGMLGPQDARVLLDEIDRLKRVGHEFCDELHEADIERNRLKAELAGLRTGFDAQNEVIVGLRKDAERYRWLRDGAGYCDTRDIPGMAPARMDEFIDAAMGKGGEA